tara:strand:- start:1490 stop:1819 length:330 start_codon:yes stop_codon:yes gene_type:complete
MKERFKHAFAIGKTEPFIPSESQKIVVEKVCREIVKRHATLPAVVMLETFRPLNYLGSQVMHFFQPIISSILTADGYLDFTTLLENRESVDYIINKLKKIDDETSVDNN